MQDFIVSRTREFYILLVSEPVKYMFNEKKKKVGMVIDIYKSDFYYIFILFITQLIKI
jgi:hypothetical protein